MKPYKNVMIVFVSMLFVVCLCPQTWAKKFAGPSPSNMSASDLKQYKFTMIASASRLDITPKVVSPGDTLSIRAYVSCNELNQHMEHPEHHLQPGDQFPVMVFEKNLSWGAVAQFTCPEPGKRDIMIHNHEWTNLVGSPETYVVPADIKPGQVIRFRLALMWYVWPCAVLAENSVTVNPLKPELEKYKPIDRKPLIEQKPAIKEQKGR